MSREYVIQKAIDRKDMSDKAVAAMAGKRYAIMPKFDGCHAQFHVKDGRFLGAETATGDVVRSCDHIGRHLAKVLPPSSRHTVVCGEVWSKRFQFAEISGMFRTHAPQPELDFVPFDMLEPQDPKVLEDPRPWEQRVHILKELYDTLFNDFGQVFPLGYSMMTTYEGAVEYAKSLKAMGGYDGAMLIDINAPYKVGRCRNGEKIKIKPLLECDLLVLGVELAHGEKTGKNTGALVCRYRDGKPVRVSTGLTQKEVDSMHEEPRVWQGRIVAVEAMGETADGLLREPRYKGIRTDKVAPDF